MRLLILLVLLPLNAFADAITYNINFVATSGPTPTGSFSYDQAAQDMTNLVFEVQTANRGPFSFQPLPCPVVAGMPTCGSSQTGDAATFALLNSEPRWEMTTAGTYFVFHIFSGSVDLAVFFDPFYDGYFHIPARGTLTISPQTVPVPEPATAATFLIGLLLVLMKQRVADVARSLTR